MPRRACSWRMSPTRRSHSDCWCSIAALRRTVTDRRRIGVLILGIATGAAAAVGVIVGYSLNPAAGIFATTHMTLLALVFLAMPASFAYAILRHRLFDLRLIIRQGLRLRAGAEVRRCARAGAGCAAAR